jgi:ParB/RepB/Spo0J family partition protein
MKRAAVVARVEAKKKVPSAGVATTVSIEKVWIDPEFDTRGEEAEFTDKLGESMAEVGQLQTVLVQDDKRQANGPGRYRIVAGKHRFLAAKKRGDAEIAVLVRRFADDDEAKLASLHENLIRKQLTPEQEAGALQEAKLIYEKRHPEARQGGDRSGGQVDQVDQPAPAKRFTAWAAEQRGVSEPTIRRKMKPAKAKPAKKKMLPAKKEATKAQAGAFEEKSTFAVGSTVMIREEHQAGYLRRRVFKLDAMRNLKVVELRKEQVVVQAQGRTERHVIPLKDVEGAKDLLEQAAERVVEAMREFATAMRSAKPSSQKAGKAILEQALGGFFASGIVAYALSIERREAANAIADKVPQMPAGALVVDTAPCGVGTGDVSTTTTTAPESGEERKAEELGSRVAERVLNTALQRLDTSQGGAT